MFVSYICKVIIFIDFCRLVGRPIIAVLNNQTYLIMTTQFYNADKLELLIDGHHGIYIPKLFSEYFPQFVTDEQREILSNPENELYWDIWEEVLNSTITNDKGEEYILMQEYGDLWAMPANMEYPEF